VNSEPLLIIVKDAVVDIIWVVRVVTGIVPIANTTKLKNGFKSRLSD
jgi:hypothetical protein